MGSFHQYNLAYLPIKLFTRLIGNVHAQIIDSARGIACIPGRFVESGFLIFVDEPANFLTQQIVCGNHNATGSCQVVF